MTVVSTSEDSDTRAVIALGILVGAGMVSLSLTGLLGRLTTASVATCLLAASAAAAVSARRLRAAPIPHLAWIGAPWIAPSALAALLPPFGWDEVAYGAALPRDFARAGRFFYNADYGAYAAFPANYESLVTASLLLTGDVRASQLLNVGLALALAVIGVLLARALGASRGPSLVAGLLVLCAPALIEVAPRTKNDVACAFFQVLSVLVLVAWRERPGYSGAILAGASLGVALGIKYSALLFVAAVAPFAVWLLARSGDSGARGLARVFAYLVATALLASPWYLRNLVLFDNPMFPFMNEVLGARNGFTPEHSALLRESFDGLRDFSFRTGTTTTFVTKLVREFGVLPMALMLPGALLALRPASRRNGLFVAGTGVAYALANLFVGYWAPRYFLCLLVIASALAALALDTLERALAGIPRAPWGLRWLPHLAVAITSAWLAAPPWRQHWQDYDDLRRGGREAFVSDHVRYIGVARWLNANMGRGDRVAIGFNIQPFYYLDRPYYHIHPLTEGDLITVRTPEQMETALRQVGATLLAFSGSDGTYFEDTAPLISGYRVRLWRAQRELRKRGRLKLVTTISGVRILRLVDPAAGAEGASAPEPRGL